MQNKIFFAVINGTSFEALLITVKLPLNFLMPIDAKDLSEAIRFQNHELYFRTGDSLNHPNGLKGNQIFRVHEVVVNKLINEKPEWVIDCKSGQPSRHCFTKAERAYAFIKKKFYFFYNNFRTEGKVTEVALVSDKALESTEGMEEVIFVNDYYKSFA